MPVLIPDPDSVASDMPVTACSGKRAVVYTAGLAGLQSQAIGLAEAAGFQADSRIVQLRRPWSLIAPRLWPSVRRVVPPEVLAPPFGHVLIGCGGAAAQILAELRHTERPAVIIQNPRLDPARFDLVIVGPHDRLAGRNVFVARTALHGVTGARLDWAARHFGPRFAGLPRPLVTVLVGGSNGRYRLDRAAAQSLARELAAMMRRDRVGLVVTPSRRTSLEVRAVLAETLAPLGAMIWDMDGENPYFGMLALADAIIVTADSVSMVSEAVATAAPVLLARLPGRSSRIGLFMDEMIKLGRVREFTGRLVTWDTSPLNDTPAAASAVRQRLGF